MKIVWSYQAVTEYEDGERTSEAIRFPWPGWWLITFSRAIGLLATRNGEYVTPKGTRVRRTADGSVEYSDAEPDA